MTIFRTTRRGDAAGRGRWNSLGITSLAILAFFVGSPARGDLLINPAGSTNFSSSLNSAGTPDPDDGSALRSLGGVSPCTGPPSARSTSRPTDSSPSPMVSDCFPTGASAPWRGWSGLR